MDPDEDDWEPDPWYPDPVTPPDLSVDIEDPVPIGELYGPNGDVIATLLDRRPIPFGFQPPGEPEP